ncbi:HAD family hydrolase [Rhizosaccharibacter radicis]|uniref:HAD family phosphatase n=1 Tax=Rhizosaccharibacter radicis TaxID=2782605 RepID=A0ABT1VVK5_9PROT|nr:HAD family phosphatase [Acetobacteraceae bacterium KSS12]
MSGRVPAVGPVLTEAPLRLVIFDCDGVLVDSEALSARVVSAACTALGFPLDAAEAERRYLGMSLGAIRTDMEASGLRVPADWVAGVQAALVVAMAAEATMIDGAQAALDAVLALGLKVRVASNSSLAEMDAKFARTGLDRRLAGLVHSGRAAGIRPKPAPDVFLAAAAAEGVPPAACLVVEDSDTGMAAAHAAGMACVVLRADGHPFAAIPGHRSRRIAHLDSLPALLREAMAPRTGAPS